MNQKDCIAVYLKTNDSKNFHLKSTTWALSVSLIIFFSANPWYKLINEYLFFLEPQVPKIFTAKESAVNTQGSVINLNCVGTGAPLPNVTWFHVIKDQCRIVMISANSGFYIFYRTARNFWMASQHIGMILTYRQHYYWPMWLPVKYLSAISLTELVRTRENSMSL